MIEFFPNMKIFLSIHLGSATFSITWYALLILSGALLAYFIAVKEASKRGYDKELLEDFFITVLPLAIVGARIYYVIFEWERYISNPISAFYIWEGGLAIHGGLIAAVLYAYWYFYHKGINLLRVGDCMMPNILIAQVIGRWGNFMNQEAYGSIVDASYFDHFPTFIKENMYINGFYRMPMFLYEGIGNLIGFILIKTLFKKYGYKKRGDYVYAYLMWYGLVRFFVEMFRTDALMIGPLRMAQCISIVFILIGLLGYIGVYDKVFKNHYPFKHEKPIILFDADGTIIDTQQLIFDSFIHTFKKYRPEMEMNEEFLHTLMGPTLYDTFGKYVPEAVEEAVAYYREFNHAKHDEYVKEIAHAKEVLATLKKEEYTLGVVSNKMTDLVERGLQLCDLKQYMDVVICFQDVQNPKPDPEGIILACKKAVYPIDDVIYVGDAAGDILAAKNMCAYSIAMVSDKHKEEALKKTKPCRMIYDLREILEIVKEDRTWDELVM